MRNTPQCLEDRAAADAQGEFEARHLSREELRPLLSLVHETKLYEAYRAEIGFGPSDIRPEMDFEELAAKYVALLQSGQLRSIHHDLLRVDIFTAGGHDFHAGLIESVESWFKARGSEVLVRGWVVADKTMTLNPVYEKIFHETLLSLIGYEYDGTARTAELQMKYTSQDLVGQSPRRFLERPDKTPPPLECFFPTPLLLAQCWVARKYIRLVEEHGAVEGLDEILKTASETSLEARDALLKHDLLAKDLRSGPQEYIDEVYRRLDPGRFANTYYPEEKNWQANLSPYFLELSFPGWSSNII